MRKLLYATVTAALLAGVWTTTGSAGVTTPRTYTVEAGDTYRNIAQRLGLSEGALACANRLSSTQGCPSVTANPGFGRIIQLSPVVPVGSTTTTTAPAATTVPATTTPPTTTPPGGTAGCGLAAAAFCETFDAPAGDPATRSGDLNATVWGVSRTQTNTNFGQGMYNEWSPATMQGCGAAHSVLPPRDVRICNGQLHEAVADSGGQPILAMYPKQPFDIAGRTGKVVFDLSADSEGPHAAWPEFWWTDQPVPAPGAMIPTQRPYARNSIGFLLADDRCGAGTSVYRFMVTRNYQFSEIQPTNVGCITRGSSSAMNHFEVRINSTRIEVWGTDAGSTNLRLLSYANVSMPLTRGVVWAVDTHYNAGKFNNQENHTFHWDNFGFDGPRPYRDLTFDVQDANVPRGNGRVNLGWLLNANRALNAPGVYWNQTPTQAYLAFNFISNSAAIPTVRVNGGPWHTMAWPFASLTYDWRTIAVPVPMSEIRTGNNVIEFQQANEVVVSNVNVILIAASPVP